MLLSINTGGEGETEKKEVHARGKTIRQREIPVCFSAWHEMANSKRETFATQIFAFEWPDHFCIIICPYLNSHFSRKYDRRTNKLSQKLIPIVVGHGQNISVQLMTSGDRADHSTVRITMKLICDKDARDLYLRSHSR